MLRLRLLGINLLGSRNTALRELVSEIPPPLVAEILGYSDKVTQKHAAEAGNYASRIGTPTTSSGRTTTTDPPEHHRTDDANESGSDSAEATLFDLKPSVRPYDVHLETLAEAAAALNDAHRAVQAAEVQLTQVMLQARRAGLS